MFKRLLVPLDATPRDEEVLVVARGLARRSGAEVLLLHVQEPIADVASVVDTHQYLERRAAEMRAQGIEARFLTRFGQPPDEIGATVEQERSDLLIMAPHHRDWLGALRHPSVTVRMLARAAVPVLAWPEHLQAHDVVSSLAVPGASVLVPLDGSELAERAVPFATRLALAFERPLLLVRVVAARTLVGAAPYAARMELEAQGAELGEARRYVGVMRRRLARDTGLAVQTMVLRGSPSHELVRFAGSHTGSIIVMSTHGRNGFARLFMGSVAADLVRESPTPMVVISPHAWHEEPDEATSKALSEESLVHD